MTREEAIKFFVRMKAEEEKTIESLKNGLGVTSSAHQRFAEYFSMAISALREQPQWISVEERLPTNIANKVLVCCKNGYVGFGHYEKFRGSEVWYNLESNLPFTDWDLEDCETYEVTHWMPLPRRERT